MLNADCPSGRAPTSCPPTGLLGPQAFISIAIVQSWSREEGRWLTAALGHALWGHRASGRLYPNDSVDVNIIYKKTVITRQQLASGSGLSAVVLDASFMPASGWCDGVAVSLGLMKGLPL